MKKIPIGMSVIKRQLFKLKIQRWLYCCLFILLFGSCRHSVKEKDYKHQYKKIDSVKALLLSGDLIVRNGIDEVSMATRKFNRKDTSYSHCGIIQIENDTAFVYHALGGNYNPSQALMRQVIDSFCNPAEVDKFSIYRYNLTAMQNNRLSEIIHEHYKNRLPFDMFFNYESDDKMYCSEFVFKSINHAAKNHLMQFHIATNPMYIAIDDLYLNPAAKLVKKVVF